MTPAEFWDRLRLALDSRRHAYRTTFNGPLAENVLKDLARFCRANESTFNDNPKVQDALEGRRQVWLRIATHLNLSPEDLWRLYSGRPSNNPDRLEE